MNEIQKQLTETIKTLEQALATQAQEQTRLSEAYQTRLNHLEQQLNDMQRQLSSLVGFVEKSVMSIDQQLHEDGN
jgi:flagellar capping protein FliD